MLRWSNLGRSRLGNSFQSISGSVSQSTLINQEKSATRLKSQTAEINLSQNLENCIVTQISRQTQTFFDG